MNLKILYKTRTLFCRFSWKTGGLVPQAVLFCPLKILLWGRTNSVSARDRDNAPMTKCRARSMSYTCMKFLRSESILEISNVESQPERSNLRSWILLDPLTSWKIIRGWESRKQDLKLSKLWNSPRTETILFELHSLSMIAWHHAWCAALGRRLA